MSGIAFKTLGGRGVDIVLLHGFGSDRLSWLGTSPALMTLGRVHALDLPGHGDSTSDVGDGSPQALAHRVAAALVANGIYHAHLVGHSLGGGIALLLAAGDPSRVASLSLIAPVGLGNGIDPTFLNNYPQLDDVAPATEMLQRLVHRPQLINKMTVQRSLSHLRGDGTREAMTAIASQIARHEIEFFKAADEVTRLDLPRLAVWGESDTINPLHRDRLAAFGGGCHIVAEAGHLPHIEAAKEVNDELASFLRRTLGR